MLSAYIDDLVQPDEKSELEEHLEMPPMPTGIKMNYKKPSILFGVYRGKIGSPASFRRELRQKLESTAEISNPKKKRSLFNISKLRPGCLWAAAAVLLLIITPFALDLNMVGRQRLSPEIAMDQKMN